MRPRRVFVSWLPIAHASARSAEPPMQVLRLRLPLFLRTLVVSVNGFYFVSVSESVVASVLVFDNYALAVSVFIALPVATFDPVLPGSPFGLST